jgi:hypothetical protein
LDPLNLSVGGVMSKTSQNKTQNKKFCIFSPKLKKADEEGLRP